MIIDIVCGREIKEETGYQSTYGDRPYSFCSRKCQVDFVGNPLRYIDKSQSAASFEGNPTVSSKGTVEPFSTGSYRK